MAKDEKLGMKVKVILNRIDARLQKLPYAMHTAKIFCNEEKKTEFSFPESIKLPEYVEKFRFFTVYPDLEENGLTMKDVQNLYDMAADLEAKKDDKLLQEACLHEEDIWKPVGKQISEMVFESFPSTIMIYLDGEASQYARIMVSLNDTGKIQYKLAKCTIYTVHSLYTDKCLRKVENEEEDENGVIRQVNVHRFFDLKPNNMLDITLDVGARFGKIGQQGMNLIDDGDFWRSPKPSQFFWLLYYQKINDGYQDMTEDLLITNDAVEKLFAVDDQMPEMDEEDPAIEFYNLVINGAKNALDEFGNDWLTNPNPYNGRMINSCWKSYAELSEAINVNVDGMEEREAVIRIIRAANDAIKKMIAVINPPFKKGVTVNSFLLSHSDIATIQEAKDRIANALTEWEGKLQAMEALTATTAKQANAGKKLSPFGQVKVTRPTEEQMQWIRDLVSKTQPGYVRLIRKAYMLDPVERRKAYEEALEKAEDKTELDVFHGTLTANVAAITACGGPTIHVAAANGRAFGNGSYWSSDPDKSAGYSSYNRYSRWAHGTDTCGWLFIGRIHYGKAYDPYGGYNGLATETAVKQGGYDTCHARAGHTCLLRDEIITYDEEHSYVQAVIMIGEPDEEENE